MNYLKNTKQFYISKNSIFLAVLIKEQCGCFSVQITNYLKNIRQLFALKLTFLAVLVKFPIKTLIFLIKIPIFLIKTSIFLAILAKKQGGCFSVQHWVFQCATVGVSVCKNTLQTISRIMFLLKWITLYLNSFVINTIQKFLQGKGLCLNTAQTFKNLEK